MKLEKNKDKVVSIRVSDDDYRLLYYASFSAGMTVSKFIRSICDATVNAVKVQRQKGVVTDEDIKAICDNKL